MSEMISPLFIDTMRFDPSEGEKWQRYCEWAQIPSLTEIVSLDSMLCPRIVVEPNDEDWRHLAFVSMDFPTWKDLAYLKQRVRNVSRKNILGLYRNPEAHLTVPPDQGDFSFIGYDLVEDHTMISALTNCGGFPEVFRTDELNNFGLIEAFDRACEIKCRLPEHYPEEPHANCELYAVWRFNEANDE